MVLKNLFRRKGRTILTLLGISIGVAAIVALGAVAQGLEAGFAAMSRGGDADLVLTQANTVSAIYSSVDQAVGDELFTWPEVADVDGMLFGNALTGDMTYLYLFGYDPQGFSIAHFRVVEGQGLADARGVRGKPLMLGRRAAQSLELGVDDVVHLAGSTFRVVGIYETGDGFEDRAGVIPLQEAQALGLQPRRVSMLYIKLHHPAGADRLRARVERRFPDLQVSTTSEFVEREQTLQILEGLAMAVAGLAVVIGGVGMTNTLFMSVFERTREIGLLRAVGWRRRQVLLLILSESLLLALLGGLLGVGLGVAGTFLLGRSTSVVGVFGSQFSPDLFVRALVTAVVLGMVGGAYPAWWASRLLPLEALHYEGGSSGHVPRRLPGGMTVRGLLRRRTRTVLTLVGIGMSIAAIVALSAIADGAADMMTEMFRASQTDLVGFEADTDPDLSAIDERVGARLAARSDVEAVSGVIFTAVGSENTSMLILFGYHPREFAIQHFRIVEGEPLTARRQVIVGRRMAEQLGLHVGDTLRILDSNFRVAGIYETGLAYEEIGVVISLREAQALTGKSHQVMYYNVRVQDPGRVEAVRDALQAAFPQVDFSLTADVAESMSDFEIVKELTGQISFLAVFVGGVGMLNTMLMSVLERTREIGVLRALGWRRRQVMGMVLRESLILGVLGGVGGILVGLGMSSAIGGLPGLLGVLEVTYSPQLFVRALLIALATGALGGLYPAWRATRMRPVEALRHE
jgi:ABC-type lipoprotein release transport system permease subunit